MRIAPALPRAWLLHFPNPVDLERLVQPCAKSDTALGFARNVRRPGCWELWTMSLGEPQCGCGDVAVHKGT